MFKFFSELHFSHFFSKRLYFLFLTIFHHSLFKNLLYLFSIYILFISLNLEVCPLTPIVLE
uniref:Uncharacterized protein n=1 Tax=uncultured marine virus TaxID=186617 RepID=A0A0F7L8S6_9VIRU|nr:hypothetical protein [uncultured marine virus]